MKVERDCYFYNWGDNPNFEYLCPKPYGARCEYKEEFLTENMCENCKNFKQKE